MKYFFFFSIVEILLSCKTNQPSPKQTHLGKVISSTYQIHYFGEGERGFGMILKLKRAPENVDFKQMVFRNRLGKDVHVEKSGNITIIEAYIPLISRKLKQYQHGKIQKEDGIFIKYDQKSYFYPIDFTLKP